MQVNILVSLYHGYKCRMCVLFLFSVEGDDYERFIDLVRFASCQRTRCIDITIIDDLLLEDVELFNISLDQNDLGNGIRLEPNVSKIEIRDNDG